MALELILSNSDTSAKGRFTYRFDVESEEPAPIEYVQRAFSVALAEMYNGMVLYENDDGACIYREPRTDIKIERFDLAFWRKAKNKITVDVTVSVPAGGRTTQQTAILTAAMYKDVLALIHEWDRDIRLGKDGKLGGKLAEKFQYLTGTNVNVVYRS